MLQDCVQSKKGASCEAEAQYDEVPTSAVTVGQTAMPGVA